MSDTHKIGKMARVRVYESKSAYRVEDHQKAIEEIAKVYDGRVGVNADGTIFGLVDDWHLPYDLPNDVIRLSHMSYYLDEWFAPAKVIERLRDEVLNPQGRFLFNAGGMGMAALWVEADDMERAFRELGLL